ncbi:MAG: hypothetical protein AB7P76_05095 [Candidatus Melainabacteria bacterium]
MWSQILMYWLTVIQTLRLKRALTSLSVLVLLAACVPAVMAEEPPAAADAEATPAVAAPAVETTEKAAPAEAEQADEAEPDAAETQVEVPMATPEAVTDGPAARKTEEDSYCYYCAPKGPFTKAHPILSRVISAPVRVALAGLGAPVGMIMGIPDGLKHAEVAMADATWGYVKEDEFESESANRTIKVLKAPVYYPLGIAGQAFSIPYGIAGGAMSGTVRGLGTGFLFLDRM